MSGPEEMTQSFEQICFENGFSVKQYSVKTTDGYILELFRIDGLLHEKHSNQGAFSWNSDFIFEDEIETKTPILFQHGLMDCSDAWVLNQSEQAPAFVAARAGYDVWLGNLRGNRYSSKHEYLDPERNAEKFFDFDIGHHHKYDLVAMI